MLPLPSSFDAREVKSRADFVAIASRYMPLRRAGRQFVGLCRFHRERHPSCYIHPEKKIFYCFGCNRGGDIFDFVMLAESCDFTEALRIVAKGFQRTEAAKRPKEHPRPVFGRGLYSPEGRARPLSLANRWPSVEDCAAERAFFTCHQPDNCP